MHFLLALRVEQERPLKQAHSPKVDIDISLYAFSSGLCFVFQVSVWEICVSLIKRSAYCLRKFPNAKYLKPNSFDTKVLIQNNTFNNSGFSWGENKKQITNTVKYLVVFWMWIQDQNKKRHQLYQQLAWKGASVPCWIISTGCMQKYF